MPLYQQPVCVHTTLPRMTPRRPAFCIKRSTVQRAPSVPHGAIGARLCQPRRSADLPAIPVRSWCPARHRAALACNPQSRITLLRRVSPIAGRRNLHHLTDRLDAVCMALLIDECPRGLKRRSNSACAKNALARRKILFVLCSSRFSLSNALRRSSSAVVGPGRWPASRSCCRTQRRSVSGVQPIFDAMVRRAPCSAAAFQIGDGLRPWPVLL